MSFLFSFFFFRSWFGGKFSPPHAHESYQVLPLEVGWGFHWVNNSSPGPFVRLLRGEPWSVEVWHPDGGGPEVVMRYFRS